MRLSSWTECWVGLVLSSPAWPRNGHEREVDEHAAVPPQVRVELAQRLEERERLDVPHRAADLRDHHVHVGRLGHEPDAVLDLVRDVRDHLDRAAQVVPAALTPDHGVVDRARGGVGGARGVGAGEALVVAEVEVRLRAVLGDEDLAVLERAHRARIHVDVRIELLDRDREPASHEKAPERCGGDPLAEGRNDPAGDEDEACLWTTRRHQALGTPVYLAGRAEAGAARLSLMPPPTARGRACGRRCPRTRRRASGRAPPPPRPPRAHPRW